MPGQNSACNAALIAILCLLLLGCQQVPKHQGLLEREAADTQLSAHQLRVMVNELVVHMADRIEIRADEILASTPDPVIRRNALLWKINGISSCFQAGTRPDPLASYLDVWILNRQMLHMFHAPPAAAHFGQWQPMVVAECDAFDRRLQHISQTLGGKLRLGEEFVTRFANDFPLTSLYFDREPIASRYIEAVQEPEREMLQVIANLGEDVDELKKLSVLFAEHLPKQVRWEAQLLLVDTSQLGIVQQPLQDISTTAAAISRVSHVTDALPELVARERQALEAMVAAERQATLRDVDRMRLDTVAHLETERAVILDAISRERMATLNALSNERQAFSKELRSVTHDALQTTDAITRQRANELTQEAPHLIDHFFWRTMQLALLGIAIAAILGWILIPRLRPQLNRTATLTLPGNLPRQSAGQDTDRLDQHAA